MCLQGGAAAKRLIGINLQELLADSFIGDVDAEFEQQLLHAGLGQSEPMTGPDAVADDFTGKAVVLVTLGIGRRGHAWLPILRFD